VRLAADLLDVLLPSPCAVCDAFAERPLTAGVCSACWGSIDYLDGPACPLCGLPHPPIEAADLAGRPCGGCRVRRPPFDAAASMGWYRGALRSMLRLLKYRDRPELARPLAERARVFLAARPGGFPEVDLVVPVPLPLLRRLRRGYNQAAEVARELARLAGRPVACGALGRRLRGRPQAGLAAARRAANVRGAFRARRPGRVAGRAVLLVDDVWTTGATLRECARVLRRARARRVVAFSLARVPESFDDPARPAL
jgi:ComF family protein